MRLAHRPPSTLAVRARDGERGAVLILVAITLSVLVTAVAFTVDLGRISTTRRDLQVVADVTALDLSRRLDGRTAGAYGTVMSSSYEASMRRNGHEPGDGTFELGTFDALTETWTASLPSEVPTAVRVEVGSRIEYQFAPGGADTQRSAVASQQAGAAFCIGSFATRVNTADGPLLTGLLNGMLGLDAATGLDLAGYRGLVGGDVGIGALATELGIAFGTPDELMDAEVTLVELLEAQAAVLANDGDLARAAILEGLALRLPNPDTLVRIGDLLEVGDGGLDAALLAEIDALDLLSAGVILANGATFVSIPAVSLGIPGVTSISGRISAVERPACAAGPIGTSAQTAVVRIELRVVVNVPAVAQVTLNLAVDAAEATGTISGLGCDTPRQLELDVTTAVVRSVVDLDAVVRAPGLFGPIDVANLPVDVTTGQGGEIRYVDLRFPDRVFGEAYQVSTPGLNLGTIAVDLDRATLVGILPIGVLLGPLLNGVVGTVVRPLLTSVETLVVTPLLKALGVTVAGADVVPLAVDCSGPQLVD